MSGIPELFHDPTSEPSRAVHWFALEAGIELDIRYTWLTRGEHRSTELLAVNPAHQVPALRHGELCLPEATAIMIYLAEQAGVQERWIGSTPAERAITHRFLSWHHSNTRRRITLDYVLPVLLMPAYKGDAPPPPAELQRLKDRGRDALSLLDALLADGGPYLGGDHASLADLFIAVDLFALDADPDQPAWFAGLPALGVWLESLRRLLGYAPSHAAWNALAPRLHELLSAPAVGSRSPHWIADFCMRHVD